MFKVYTLKHDDGREVHIYSLFREGADDVFVENFSQVYATHLAYYIAWDHACSYYPWAVDGSRTWLTKDLDLLWKEELDFSCNVNTMSLSAETIYTGSDVEPECRLTWKVKFPSD